MIKIEKKGSDNALENYFLELVINKHVVDREIEDTIMIIEKSALHPDYQILIKKVLFGKDNLYLEKWGTLGSSLIDMVRTADIRGHEIDRYGVVLGIMLRVIEEVFDVDDEHFHDFLMSETKETIEHELIILIKRVLDFIEKGLKDMFENTQNLGKPIIDNHIRREFTIIRDTLLQYSGMILESEGKHIRALKHEVNVLMQKITDKKKHLQRISR